MDPKEPPRSPAEERIKQYLSKPVSAQNLDPELRTQLKSQNTLQRRFTHLYSYYDSFIHSRYYQQKYRQWNRFSRESLPMIVFVTFATYLIWKMESQYDGMRQKIQNIKSYHERDIEEEDKYIASVLQNKPINLDVQIREPQKKNQKYKFQDDDRLDPGSVLFNTKDDFLHGLEKDLGRGIKVPDEFKAEFDDFMQRRKKV